MKTKEDYYLEKFNNVSGNTKAQWKMVNNLIGTDDPKKTICDIEINGCHYTSEYDIASGFNEYFLNVANSFRSSISLPQFNNSFEQKFS